MSLMRRRDLLQRSASALLAALLAKAGPASHAATTTGTTGSVPSSAGSLAGGNTATNPGSNGIAGQAAPASAGTGIELQRLSVQRSDEGTLLSYDIRIELPADLEQALGKGIAVVFLAEAEVFRERWYWTDESRGRAFRRWRLAYQPLTRQWRLNQEGLSRHFSQLSEALDAIRRAERWRIADNISPSDTADYHVDFSFKLDTAELPRPLQIGLGGQSDWKMGIERRVAIPSGR